MRHAPCLVISRSCREWRRRWLVRRRWAQHQLPYCKLAMRSGVGKLVAS